MLKSNGHFVYFLQLYGFFSHRFLSHHNSPTVLLFPVADNYHLLPVLSKPKFLPFSPYPKCSKSRILSSVAAPFANPVIKSAKIQNPSQDLLSGSTQTLTTLLATALIASKFFAGGILSLAVQLKSPLVCTAGLAFFATMKDVPTGSFNTLFTVMAAGMVKWLTFTAGF